MNINQLVWSEYIRPKNLSEVIGQEAVIVLKSFVSNKNVVDCTISGPPGCGKTSAVVSMAKELYGTTPNENGISHFDTSFRSLNASDERGIDVVRTTIKDFTTNDPSNPEVPFLLMYLDEADKLTNDAQDALRATMEAHSNNCRFISSCNNQFGLTEALRSRGPIIPFTKLSFENLKLVIIKACEIFKVTISEEALIYLINFIDGDSRKMLKYFQMAAMINPNIDLTTLKRFIPSLEQKTIDKLLEFTLQKDFVSARSILNEIYATSKNNPELILSCLSKSIIANESKFSSPLAFMKTQSKLGEISYRIPQSINPSILLTGLISDIIFINTIPVHCIQVKE